MKKGKIDMNADMGESHGRWVLGNDTALMPLLSSANLGCGFHGGDPHVMRATIRLARQHGVAIGAHVSLPDILGFGRRRMDISPQELKDYVTYQVGALQALAMAEGVQVEHVKPHGALYVMCTQEDSYAQAIAETVREINADLILLLSGQRVAAAAKRVGIRFVMEGYIDLNYHAEGHILLERVKKSRDPNEVAERAVTLAKEGKVPIQGGGWLPLKAKSICIHGDGENAPAIAKTVRQHLRKAGFEIVPLRLLI